MKHPSGVSKGFRDRAFLIFGVAAYILVYQWIYVNYLYPLFGGTVFGYEYRIPSTGCIILAWVLSLSPAAWMPLALTRASHLAYWILYVIIIIPSMFTCFYIGLNRQEEVVGLVLTLFFGFLIVGISYLFPLLPIKPRPISPRVFWSGFTCLTLGLTLWVVIVFRSKLQLVSFANAYDLRFAADEITRGNFGNYPLMILSGAVGPFLMAWGLYRRRAILVLAGMLMQLLVYSAYATKAALTAIVFIPGIYLTFRTTRRPFALKLVWGTVVVLVASCVSYVVVGKSPSPLHQLGLFLLFVRVVSTNAVLNGQYYNFFHDHPVTYYAHVRVLNWLAPPYPYGLPIGNELGYFYSGSPEWGATVDFWAADGIAALGLGGILAVSVVCMLVFWLLDSVAKRHDPRFAALTISYAAAWNLTNNGLFTTLLSGGLAMLILMLYVMPAADHRAPAKKRVTLWKRFWQLRTENQAELARLPDGRRDAHE